MGDCAQIVPKTVKCIPVLLLFSRLARRGPHRRGPRGTHAIDFLAAMFGQGAFVGVEYPLALYLDFELGLWLAIAVVLSGAWMGAARKRVYAWAGPAGFALVRVTGLVWVFVGSSISLVAGTHSPFVYFRF